MKSLPVCKNVWTQRGLDTTYVTQIFQLTRHFLAQKNFSCSQRRWMAPHLFIMGEQFRIMEILQRWRRDWGGYELKEGSHDWTRWYFGLWTRTRLGRWRLRKISVIPRDVIKCPRMGSSVTCYSNQGNSNLMCTRWMEWSQCIRMVRFSSPRRRKASQAITLQTVWDFR